MTCNASTMAGTPCLTCFAAVVQLVVLLVLVVMVGTVLLMCNFPHAYTLKFENLLKLCGTLFHSQVFVL